MSHFVVMVIGDDPEGQLAPYQENNMEDCPKEYLSFHDTEDEHRKEYETGTETKIKMPDGTLVSPHNKQFLVQEEGCLIPTQKVVYPAGSEEVEVPFKELYPTFEDFMNDYHNYKRDPQTGRYGYWENPNAKWDWYSLGGRWTGFLKLKETPHNTPQYPKHAVGTPGLLTSPARKGYADMALLRDIDIEGMREEAGVRAKEHYERMERLLGGTIPKLDLLWKDILEGEEYKDLSIKEKRALYQDQPAMHAIREARSKGLSREDAEALLWFFEEIEDLQCSKEEFIQRAKDQALMTFAIVKDGEWYERGSMGWWGIVTDEKNNREWEKEFSNLLNSLPGETLISIYDCHI